MPFEELMEWRAYWQIKSEAEAKSIEKARREAESKSKSFGRR